MTSDLLVLSADPAEVATVVDEARSDVRYVVTDFPVESIVAKFKDVAEDEGDIYIPPYQRSLAWTDEQGSYLVESLLLKVPVPPIFLYDVKGRLEIVDGSQRIRSLVRYFNNQFKLNGLEKIDVLNGYYFRDLPAEVQRRLRNTPLRSFVIEEGTDAGMRVELFRRLNTSGKKLQDAEIRKGAFRGPFLDLVIECAESPLFVDLTEHLAIIYLSEQRYCAITYPRQAGASIHSTQLVFGWFVTNLREYARKSMSLSVIAGPCGHETCSSATGHSFM